MDADLDEADRVDLLEALAYQRTSVRAIVDGLSEGDWHRPVLPTAWTVAGMVAHLGGAERHWTCDVIRGDDPGHPFDADLEEAGDYDPLAPFVTGWPSAQVLGYYADQARLTDETLAVTALGAAPRGRHGGPDDEQPGTVRQIVLHLIEETAAHSGHLEVVRELLDGSVRLGLR